MAQILKKKTFAKAMRGYSTEEVDAYVDLLLESYNAVSNENDENKRRLAAVLRKLQALSEGAASIPVPTEASEAESRRIIEEAEAKAKQIIESAEKNAQDIVRSAQTEARNKAVTITAEARQAATDAEAYAKKQYDSAQKLYQEIFSFRDKLFGMYSDHIEMLESIAEEANTYFDNVGNAGEAIASVYTEETAAVEVEKVYAEPMEEAVEAEEAYEEPVEEAVEAEEAYEEPVEEAVEAEEVYAESVEEAVEAEEAYAEPMEEAVEAEEAYAEPVEEAVEAEEAYAESVEEAVEAEEAYAEPVEEAVEAEEAYAEPMEDDEIFSENMVEPFDVEGVFTEPMEIPIEPEAVFSEPMEDAAEAEEPFAEPFAEEFTADFNEPGEEVIVTEDDYPVSNEADDIVALLKNTFMSDSAADDLSSPYLDFAADEETDEEIESEIRIDWSTRRAETTSDEDEEFVFFKDENEPEADDAGDFHEMDALFAKGGNTDDFSLTDEFDIVYSSRNSERNVREIEKQPLVAPERPTNPKKHRRF